MSDAMASLDDQRSMIERNDFGGLIESDLGQFVLTDKAKVSRDCEQPLGDNIAMADRMSETDETLAYIARVRAAREAKFKTQKPVYTFLGVDQQSYKHWETNRPLPRRHVPKFCIITEVKMEWLLANEGEGPPIPDPAKKREPRIRRRKRAAA